MSRKNRRKNQRQAGQPVQKPPSPPPVALSRPTPETETDKRQDQRITWSFVIGGVSFLLSIFSVYFSCVSAEAAKKSADEAAAANKLTQAAQDRAAGKLPARFEFVDEKNRDPNRHKEFMRKKDGSDQLVFRIESADELLRWGPQVRIKNTGTEPIDALRIDVKYLVGATYGVGVYQIDPPPIVVNEVSSHEATTFGKLQPGQTAAIRVAPLLLNQMTTMNWKDFPGKDRLGIFTVSIFCRLVGSASYDQMTSDATRVFEFHWRPSGFEQDAKHVKELLEIKPLVTID